MTESTQMLVRKVISKTSIYIAVVTIVLVIAFFRDISYAFGFLFGSIAALINFYLVSYSIDNLFSGKAKSRWYYAFFYIIRLALSALIMWKAIQLNSLNLFTATLGLFSVKISLTIDALIKHYISKTNTYEV